MTLYSVIISKNIKYVVPPKLMLCCNTSITLKSFKLFIYLYLTVLGLHCSTGFSLVVASRSFSLAVVQQLLIVLVFLGVEHRLWDPGASVVAARGCNSCSFRALEYRLSRCGPGAWLLPSTWNLPLIIRDQTYVSFIGRWFFTTELPGKPFNNFIFFFYFDNYF